MAGALRAGIAALMLAAGAVGAKDPFPVTIPECFGFCSHYWDFQAESTLTWSMRFWQPPLAWWGAMDPLDSMAASGFLLHLTHVAWNDAEREKGVYDFRLSDSVVETSVRRGIRPVYILGYGNGLYDTTAASSTYKGLYGVTTQAGRDGYVNWARQLARRYKGKGVIYEVWSEPNIPIFWGSPDPEAYVKLVAAAAPAIRQEDPDALIVGGALSPKNMDTGLDVPFISRCMQLGMLEQVDIVSFHPFNVDPPEKALEQMQQLKALIKQYQPAGKTIEIMATGVGYVAWLGNPVADVIRYHGHYVPRLMLSHQMYRAPVTWYDMEHWGEYSLVDRPKTGFVGTYFDNRMAWAMKPGVAAIRVCSNALRGYGFSRRIAAGDTTTDFILEFVNGAKKGLAAWTTSSAQHAVSIPLAADTATLVTFQADSGTAARRDSLMGDYRLGVRKGIRWSGNTLSLTVSNWPQYVLVGGAGSTTVLPHVNVKVSPSFAGPVPLMALGGSRYLPGTGRPARVYSLRGELAPNARSALGNGVWIGVSR